MDKTAETNLAARLENILHPNGIMNKVAEDDVLVVDEVQETPEETVTLEDLEALEDAQEVEEVAEVVETEEPVAEKLAQFTVAGVLSHPDAQRGFQETFARRSEEIVSALEKKAMEMDSADMMDEKKDEPEKVSSKKSDKKDEKKSDKKSDEKSEKTDDKDMKFPA